MGVIGLQNRVKKTQRKRALLPPVLPVVLPLVLAVLLLLLLPLLPVFPGLNGVAVAASGDSENGAEIYMKRCWWCHGDEGAADGPAADFLIPPPRDFTEGVYKFKSTPFEEMVPSDDDYFKMIKGGHLEDSITGWTGMNDTSMPGWGDMLSDQEIWDLVAYIKEIVEYEEPEEGPISLSGKIASSGESLEKGKKIFKKMCSECHGEQGKGDGTKKLKDDLGYRTWPRNLTKPWSFRAGNSPEDIFTRVTVSIGGTQMPSFADPASKKKLSDEERWHVANYAASLGVPYKKPTDNTVVKALRVEGDVPSTPGDEAWVGAEYTSLYMIPQIIAEERHFTPSLNSISVKTAYNDTDIAFLLEWDDRSKSLPGDKKAEEVAGAEVTEDAVAIQFPAQVKATEKPYFGMGDAANPVNIWHWKSGPADDAQTLSLLNSTGFTEIEERDPTEASLTAKGAYDNGTWRVVIKRPLHTEHPDRDLQFVEGRFTPIAFAAWDGSNEEEGSKHVMTSWVWLLLKPPTGASVFLIPLLVAVVIFIGQLLLLRSYRKK